MRYTIEGEEWLPAHDAKREFGVTLEELLKLAEEGKVRVRIMTNPHNEKDFTVYSVSDLEELFPPKKAKANSDNVVWF